MEQIPTCKCPVCLNVMKFKKIFSARAPPGGFEIKAGNLEVKVSNAYLIWKGPAYVCERKGCGAYIPVDASRMGK